MSSNTEALHDKVLRVIEHKTLDEEAATQLILNLVEARESTLKAEYEEKVRQARLDELNHLGFDKRLDNPILSCFNESEFGAITLEERIAELNTPKGDKSE